MNRTKGGLTSVNTSKAAGLGTSTNINKSGAGLLGANGTLAPQFSNFLNESAMDVDIEYGYCTEEDSVFASFK